MKHFYIIANLDKEYVQEAQVFIKAYLEAKGVFNHLIIIFQLAAFLLYHIVLILWNAVHEPILIIGDGKYNVKIFTIVLHICGRTGSNSGV